MSNPSTIFLNEHSLTSGPGDAIFLNDSGVISTSKVGIPNNTKTTISNYDNLSPSVLLNGSFADGTTTDWITSGSVSIVESDYPGVLTTCQVDNLAVIFQQVDNYENKHAIFTFWHKGMPALVSLELHDISDAYLDGVNQIFQYAETWERCSIVLYNYFGSEATSARCTIFSDNDGCLFTNSSLLCVDNLTSLDFGEIYNDNYTDIIRMHSRKLMLGTGLAGINDSLLDVRGNQTIIGDLTVTGTITSGPIYGSIGTQTWVTNIVFTSGSPTQINWSSGLIQLISGTSFGISLGNTPAISGTSYIYLDTDISSTILQVSSTYSDVIGPNKIFIGIAIQGTTGNASFISQSNNQPLINATDLIIPFSISNGVMAVNSIDTNNIIAGAITADKITVSTLSAITASMGSLQIDNLLTMKETTSAITIGLTGTLPISANLGTGIWLDRNGIYSLNSDVQQATLTNLGLSAGNNNFIADSSGIFLNVISSYSDTTALTFRKSGIVEGTLYLYDDGVSGPFSGYKVDTSSTGANLSYPADVRIEVISKTNFDASLFMTAKSESGETVSMYLYSFPSGQSAITLNNNTENVDTIIYGSGNEKLYFDASTGFFGIGTSSPLSKLHIANNGSGGTAGAVIRMEEVTPAPSAPASNQVIIYCQDNGGGKTQLMARFASGVAQQIAIEP